MHITYHELVYPEGDIQETRRGLHFNDVVGLNGEPLVFPLNSTKIIAYRVYKITRKENKGETRHQYHLEIVRKTELDAMNN